MTLRWEKIERKLRRRVKTEVRTSTALRRERKHIQRGRWWNVRVSPGTYRLIFWFIALSSLLRGVAAVELILAFIWLWGMGAAFWQTGRLQSALYFAGELGVFQHLPISDGEVFHAQWRKFLRGMIWPTLDFVVLYSALAYQLGARWQTPLVGLGFGCLQGLFIVGIAASLLGIGFRNRLPMLALLCYAGALGVLFLGGRTPELVKSLAAASYWIPPAGWIRYALGVSTSQGAATDWVPSLIAGIVLAGYPVARRRLLRGYVLSEAVFARAFQFTATGEAAALQLKDYGGDFAQTSEATSDQVKAGALTERMDWRQAGWVERLVARVLTERERTLAEFLTAGNPGWSKSWRTTAAVGCFLLIAAIVFPMQFASAFGTFGFVMVAFMVAVTNWNRRGFGAAANIGLPPPLYAYYPLGFAEMHRTVTKIMLVRYLLGIPILAVAAGLFATSLKLNPALVVSAGVKIFLAGAAAQPLLALMPFSATSNDSDRFHFALPAVAYGLIAIASGAVFVFVQNIAIASLGGLVGAGLCWFAAWLYGRRFNQSKFDLLPSARNSTSTPSAHG